MLSELRFSDRKTSYYLAKLLLPLRLAGKESQFVFSNKKCIRTLAVANGLLRIPEIDLSRAIVR